MKKISELCIIYKRCFYYFFFFLCSKVISYPKYEMFMILTGSQAERDLLWHNLDHIILG